MWLSCLYNLKTQESISSCSSGKLVPATISQGRRVETQPTSRAGGQAEVFNSEGC